MVISHLVHHLWLNEAVRRIGQRSSVKYLCVVDDISCVPMFPRSTMPGGQQQQPQKHYGITSAISLAPPRDIDHQYTKKLCDAMKPFGVFEDEEELNHRWGSL